jgi:Glucodextranase, domain B
LTRTALPFLLVVLLAGLFMAQPAGGAIVPSSNIDTPSDGFHFWADQSSTNDFTVHGTTSGIAGSVDINCYTAGGYGSVVPNVTVTAGEFNTPVTNVQAYNAIGAPCVLRAVPHGDTDPHPPSASSDPYQGPRVAESWGDTSETSGLVSGYDFVNNGFGGEFELKAVGEGGLATSELFAPGSVSPSESLFYEDAYTHSGSQITVDGQEADAASFDAGAPGVPAIQVTKTLDPATGALTVTDREPLVKCTSMSCTSDMSAGVELDRTWQTGSDGKLASLTDSWRSTDGSQHSLDAIYVESFNTSSAHGAFLFPGSSGFQDYAHNASVAFPHGPGTVFVKEDGTTPDAGDGTHPQGAVTYASAPDSSAVFTSSDQDTPNYSEWDAHYVRTIPASGAVTLRFSYAQAYALSDVQALAQETLAGFAPSLAIASPANGSSSTSAGVTVSGTASDDAGIASLTVNGHAVSVQSDGSWSAPVTLAPGANTVTAVATDADGITTQRQITITYTPHPSSPPTAHLALLGVPHALANGVSLRLSCSAASCSGTATLTATELLSKPGGKLLGVTAARKRKKKTVTVGRASFSIQAGATKTVTVKLNASGRKLLKRFKRLPVQLQVKLSSGAKPTTVATKKLTIKKKKR